MNHALAVGGFVSILVALSACASAPEETAPHERVGSTSQAMMMYDNGGDTATTSDTTTDTTTYTCSGSNGCYVSNGQCMCQSNCVQESNGTWYCWQVYGWSYYAWNPCPYPENLYCNSYGTCWCQ